MEYYTCEKWPKKFSQGDFIGDNNENILLILPWGMEKGNALKNEFVFFLWWP